MGSFANGDATFWLKRLHVLKPRAVPAEGTIGTPEGSLWKDFWD
jgi:hypothetical protein